MTTIRDDSIGWEDVARRFETPRNYWLVTVDTDGAPHVAPVWGAVHSGSLYCFSDRVTRKSKNLLRDNRVALHLESANHVVIVHGRLVDVGDPGESPDVVWALRAKYSDPEDAAYLPSLEAVVDSSPVANALYRLEPDRALMWNLDDFSESQKRWRR